MILRERESLDHGFVDQELNYRLVVLSVLSIFNALGALGTFGALGALGVGALPFFFW